MAGRVVIGTSSWADRGFVEEWYPPGLPARERLGWYAEHFDGVEVNSTFYALPSLTSVERWVEQTPEGFTFDWKLHRLLSRHYAALDSLPEEARAQARTGARGRVELSPALEAELASRTHAAIEPLVRAGRLSTLLLQLTPAFAPGARSLAELEPLIGMLAPHPVAIELRHRAWTRPEHLPAALAWFEQAGAIWVGVDAPQVKSLTAMPPLDAATHPRFGYIRAHGRNAEGYVRGRTVAERFGWEYSDEELGELAGRAQDLARQVPEVRLMFNNNRGGDAPRAAERMRDLLAQPAGVRAG